MGTAKTQRLLLLLLGVVTIAVYSNSLENSFHYDDIHSLVDNPHVRSLGNLPAFFYNAQMFSEWGERAMYRPLVLVSYALNYATSEYQVRGYHVVNLIVHLLNVLVVFSIGRVLVSSRTHGTAPAGLLIAASIFALHPINAEVVNWLLSWLKPTTTTATRCSI